MSTAMGMTLADAASGSQNKVVSLQGDDVLTSRLRELGFITGEWVRVLGRAPFGEPILIEIRGSTVALRRLEAECVCL